MKSRLLGTFLACFIAIASANATVINTINGVDYEWMELTATVGLSRNEIETLLADKSSSFYGYRYATRLETQELLYSYTGIPPFILEGAYSSYISNAMSINGI